MVRSSYARCLDDININRAVLAGKVKAISSATLK